MTITIPSGRTLPLQAKSGGGFASSALSLGGGQELTGTGFGTKPAGVNYFEDFSGFSTGAISSATLGELVVLNIAGTSITSSESISGSQCLSQDYSVSDFPKIHKTLGGTNGRGYQCGWIKWSGTVSGSTVWKFARFGGNTVYSGVPHFSDSYTSTDNNTPTGFGTEIVTSDGLTGFAANATAKTSNVSALFTVDTWHFYELEIDAGTVDGNDAFIEVRLDGQTAIRFENAKYLTTANSTLLEWAMTPINGLDLGPNITMLMDDYYVDESRARVIITDSAVYANSTEWAIQPITSWSDTAIEVTKRTATLTAPTLYWHAWDDSGAKVIDGQEVSG